MSKNDINYEALGRYIHLKQQRDTLSTRLMNMESVVGLLQVALENPQLGRSDRLRKATKSVAAILPEIIKINQEEQEITAEMTDISARHNLGGLECEH